jgi:zinc protease
LRKEIARIVREPVGRDEIEAAISYLTGSFVFHFQKNLQVADFLVEAEVYALSFDYLEKYPEMIRNVTIDDVAQVARKHIDPEHMTTVVVGPVKEGMKDEG